jgi:hypothetical protein
MVSFLACDAVEENGTYRAHKEREGDGLLCARHGDGCGYVLRCETIGQLLHMERR